MELLAPSKDYVTDYLQVGAGVPGTEGRPVGIPGVFFPLDTCGRPLDRRGLTLQNQNKKKPAREFIVSIYTKSANENPERGLVVKLYERSTSSTAVLHVGASELINICARADEPDLLRDLVYAQEELDAVKLDDVEANFSAFSKKGELEGKTRKLTMYLMDIIVGELGFKDSPTNTVVPYIKSDPRGIPPN